MASSKFDPTKFFASPEAVAALVDDAEIFSLLNRRITLPPDVTALVTRNGAGQVVCPPGNELDGEGVSAVLFVRTAPINLSWTFERVNTSDHFQAEVHVGLRVRPSGDRGELMSLGDQLIGSKRLANRLDLQEHLEPTIRNAVVRLSHDRTIESLARGGDDIQNAIAEAVAGPCFEAGLLVEDQPTVQFASTAFDQVRRIEEQAVRKKHEHAVEQQLNSALSDARQEHLAEVEELLGRLKQLSDESPDVEMPDLVRSFSESQRGQIYEALFAASGRESLTRWIVVAAGNELLYYAPDSAESPARRVSMDGAVGLVRSVRASKNDAGLNCLLAGAARGVYEVIDQDEPVITSYALALDVDVRGGFNSAAATADRIYATHSEMGLVCWERSSPEVPQSLLPGLTESARAVRGAQVFDGRIFCSIDQDVLALEANDPTESSVRVYRGSNSLITAICPTPTSLYAGNAEGQILRWPQDGDAKAEIIHAGSRRPAESLHTVTAGGISRLLFTDTTTAVHARVMGDTFGCRYEAGGQTIRRVEVAPDWIVATNELRDRLLLFKPGKAAAPSSTISVARQTGHSIQDVCML